MFMVQEVKKKSVGANFSKDAIKNGTINIFGDGTQTRDFIYVKDLCEGIFLLLIIQEANFPDSNSKANVKNLAKEIKKTKKKIIKM